MLRATDDERDAIIAYYLGQSPDGTEVRFLQKVYSEAVLGHRHDVWDVHASDGRWWVITNPTNLYSQDQFPNMDLAVTFHMGLCLRIPKSQKGSFSRRQVAPIGDVIQQIHDIDEALSQALRLADYQGIGVRCREALLAFVAAAQDVMEWTDQAELPKRADFRAWNDLIWNRMLAGGDQAERRRLVKSAMSEAWVFSNWLTHAKSATWRDAEASTMSLGYCLGMATNILILHLRGVPDQCPECGSRRLEPEEGLHTSAPELVVERAACADCGWRGEPVVVERDEEEMEDLVTRKGWQEDGCLIPTVPLMELVKPSGRKG